MIIRDNNLQKWLFDYFEGNLTPLEEVELRRFIQANPEHQNEFDAWEKSYKGAQENSSKNRVPVYAGASSLLVNTSIWSRMNWRAAASIAVILMTAGLVSYLVVPSENNKEEVVLTNTTNLEVVANELIGVADVKDQSVGKEIIEGNQTLLTFDVQGENEIMHEVPLSGNSFSSLDGAVYASNETMTNASTDASGLKTDSQIENNKDLSFDRIMGKQPLAIQANFLEGVLQSRFPLEQKEINKSRRQVEIIEAHEIHQSVERVIRKQTKKRKIRKYYYQGYRDVAGSGIRTNKIKDEKTKSLKKGKVNEQEGVLIAENVHKESGFSTKLKRKKKMIFNGGDLALKNLYDPIFIQRGSHPIALNPALVGQVGFPRLKTATRLQNNNSKDHSLEIKTSYDMYLEKIKAGVSIIGSHKEIGKAFSTNSLGMIYAQKFDINRESSVTTAVKYTIGTNNIDANQLSYNEDMELDNGDVVRLFDEANGIPTSKLTHDMGAGVWYNGEYFYGGIAMDNILKSSALNYNAEMMGSEKERELTVQLGTDYRKSAYSNLIISPQITYLHTASNRELWVGSIIKYGNLIVGAGANPLNKQAVKGVLGIQNNTFRLSYGADVTKSVIESKMFVSHELSLRILFGANGNNWSRF